MIRLLFIVALIANVLTGIAQTSYFLIGDFGSTQSTGEVIIEHDGYFYIAGQYIIPDIVERNIQICKLDKDGDIKKCIVWDNDLSNGGLNSLANDAISLIDDKTILMNINVGANVHECIISVDTSLAEVKLRQHYTTGIAEGITGESQLLVDDILYISIGNQFRKNYFGAYDLALESFTLIHHNVGSEDTYNQRKLLCKGNEIFHLCSYLTDNKPADKLRQLLVQVIDKQDFSIKEEFYLEENFGHTTVNALFAPNGNIVVSGIEGDRNEEGEYIFNYNTILMELESDNSSIKWKQVLGDTMKKRSPDYLNSMITAVDNNGYVLVGQKSRGPNTVGEHDGFVIRVDSLGQELWQFETVDDYEGAYVTYNDVIVTSDGHYMAVGYRSDTNRDADPWSSRVQTVMIKFDDEGNIIQRPSAIDEAAAVVLPIKIYPNPAASLLTIESQADQTLIAFIMDATGQKILPEFFISNSEEKLIDVSAFVSGVYQVIIQSKDGRQVMAEQVVIEN